MKHLGNLLLTISLITGMISAATSYFAFVDQPAEAFAADEGGYVRLKAGAGAEPFDEAARTELRARYDAGELSAQDFLTSYGAIDPVLGAGEDDGGTELTPERVDALRSAGVQGVFTKSFSLERWRYWWVFLLSAIGLLIGSRMVRTAAKAEIEAATSGGSMAGAGGAPAATPEATLDALVGIVANLRAELESMGSGAARLTAIRERVGAAQQNEVTSFVEARPILVGRLGLGRYAEMMDRFAAAERQINRAWSAAADGVLEEAEVCLANAQELAREAHAKLVG